MCSFHKKELIPNQHGRIFGQFIKPPTVYIGFQEIKKRSKKSELLETFLKKRPPPVDREGYMKLSTYRSGKNELLETFPRKKPPTIDSEGIKKLSINVAHGGFKILLLHVRL